MNISKLEAIDVEINLEIEAFDVERSIVIMKSSVNPHQEILFTSSTKEIVCDT